MDLLEDLKMSLLTFNINCYDLHNSRNASIA